MNVIPAILAPTRANEGAARRSKASLREALRHNSGPGEGAVEFISQSMFHRPGSWFTVAEAVDAYGPVTIECRNAMTGSLVVIEAMYQSAGGFTGDKATPPLLVVVR